MMLPFPSSLDTSAALGDAGVLLRAIGQSPDLLTPGDDRLRSIMRRLGEGVPIDRGAAATAWAMDTVDSNDWHILPPRGLGAWLATLYVTRDRWVRPAAWSVVAGAIAFGAYTGGAALMEARRVAQEQRVAEQRLRDEAGHQSDVAAARKILARLNTSPVHPKVDPHIALLAQQASDVIAKAEASSISTGPRVTMLLRNLENQMDGWRGLVQLLDTEYPDVSETYRSGQLRIQAAVDAALEAGNFQATADAINAKGRHQYLTTQYESLGNPVATSEDAAAALESVRASIEASLVNGDNAVAERQLQELETLRALIATPLTTRIVDRPGARSGVWRHPIGNESARRYYLVVESLDASGSPYPIPVTNEETQRRSVVSEFAIRVPESVFERIKNEKVGTGLISEPVIGQKPAGELTTRYHVETLGGVITEW